MPTSLGHNAFVRFGDESTYGTAASTFEALEFLEESLALKQSMLSRPSIRRVSQEHRVKSKRSVEGNLKFQATFDGMEKILKHALGSSNVTGAGPYTHAFTLATALPVGLTFDVDRDNSGFNSKMWRYLGCQIKKLTLAQKMEDFLTVDVEIVGRDATTTATASPTYPTFNGIDYEMLTLTLGGNSVSVEEFELTLENDLAEDRYVLGSRLRKGIGRRAQRKVTGKIVCELEAETHYNQFLNQSNVAIVATWTGSGTDALTVTVPRAYVQGDDPSVSEPGPVKLNLTFEAFMDAAANDELDIELVNSTGGPD